MWPFSKKSGTQQTDQAGPGSIHPKHKIPPPVEPIKNEASAPAKPKPPPIAPALTASEIADMRKKGFENIGVDFETVLQIEKESAGFGQLLRIDPDRLTATGLEINDRLKQYFIAISVSSQEALLCLFEQSKYEAEFRRQRAAGNRNARQLSILEIVIWREAERRQKRLMDLPPSEYLKYGVKQQLAAGTKEIFDRIIAESRIQQEREQAKKRIRFEKNLKPADPIKDEDVDAMIRQIKNRRTPPPRQVGMPADDKAAAAKSKPK